MNIKTIPLRERKKARTRLSIMNAVVGRLREKRLADITVEEICDEVQISKGTFFLYFPRKIDVMVLYALLWNLETLWRVTKAPGAVPGLAAIESMFRKLGRMIEDHPTLWAEVIAIRAYQPEAFALMGSTDINQVSLAERLLHFPDLEGIETVPEGNFKQFFELNLKEAVKNGDISEKVDLSQVFMSLACIFYGVPLMSFEKHPMNCEINYMKQIQQLWSALGIKS